MKSLLFCLDQAVNGQAGPYYYMCGRHGNSNVALRECGYCDYKHDSMVGWNGSRPEPIVLENCYSFVPNVITHYSSKLMIILLLSVYVEDASTNNSSLEVQCPAFAFKTCSDAADDGCTSSTFATQVGNSGYLFSRGKVFIGISTFCKVKW